MSFHIPIILINKTQLLNLNLHTLKIVFIINVKTRL